jgi:sucrose phosphorylase
MLNAYPDSIGKNLADTVEFLKRPELKDAFSLFYILPTFFNSDLDRGFSIIDYNINEELVSPQDLDELNKLGIQIKLDLVLNHLSVRSPQFQDLLKNGKDSLYRDFFIDWDEFWDGQGTMGPDDYVVPNQEHLAKLFMRKPGLPVLRVRFPDGSLKTYWNTFYQKVDFEEITARDFADIKGLDPKEAQAIADRIKIVIKDKGYLTTRDFEDIAHLKDAIIRAVCGKREYLGQMDLNARSELVWEFYDETLRKLSEYGAKIIRLDAFAYLHKEPGQPNFFNRPGTWDYLKRLRSIAQKYNLTIFPEIHAEYGSGIHEEIAQEGYPIYDFFFPGLLIDALDRGSNEGLLHWIADIRAKGLQTITMLGCHDGIPLLDLRGKQVNGTYRPGLLNDEHIDAAMARIVGRGGMTKNLYGADGRKIDYYQVNATYFSALGEDERKLRLARAIQMFMPGIPQVWYLDLFAGINDYAAAHRGRTAGHKEINRTTLRLIDIETRLKCPIVLEQLDLIRLRNVSPAFSGEMNIFETEPHLLHISWQHPEATATLQADLRTHSFTVYRTVYRGGGTDDEIFMSFE